MAQKARRLGPSRVKVNASQVSSALRSQHSMYRQSMMADTQEQQIFTKLGELPMVNDAYTQVLDIYERTKGHNRLFGAYFWMVEGSAKMAADLTYKCLHTPIDKVNDFACQKLDSLETAFPIITRPTQEVIQETQEKYETYRPYIEPVAKPVLVPAKLALKAGKAAIDVGTTVATVATKPAVYTVKTGMAVTSAVVNTGKSAVNGLATSLVSGGGKMVENGMESSLGKFIVQQTDLSLESLEKLMDFYIPPTEKSDAATRRERVAELARRIHVAVSQKAKGDLVRYQLVLSNFLRELTELFGYLVVLSKDTSEKAAKEVNDAVAILWENFVNQLPEPLAKEVHTVKERIATMLVFLMGKITELVSNSKVTAQSSAQGLSNLCSQFLAWCKTSPELVKTHATQIMSWIEAAMPELARFNPAILEITRDLLDKALDTLDVFGVGSMMRRQGVAELQEGENIEMDEMN